MEEILKYTINNSFAIVISVFLLVRMETKISELSKSINELSNVIQKKY